MSQSILALAGSFHTHSEKASSTAWRFCHAAAVASGSLTRALPSGSSGSGLVQVRAEPFRADAMMSNGSRSPVPNLWSTASLDPLVVYLTDQLPSISLWEMANLRLSASLMVRSQKVSRAKSAMTEGGIHALPSVAAMRLAGMGAGAASRSLPASRSSSATRAASAGAGAFAAAKPARRSRNSSSPSALTASGTVMRSPASWTVLA